jgi:ubiquinone/menaquinone biosynthesis C-methylase UbiE
MATPQASEKPQADGEFPKSLLLAEHITAPFGRKLIEHSGILGSTSDEPKLILDNAAGLGNVAAELQRSLAPNVQQKSLITCLEISPLLVKYIRHRIRKKSWTNVSVVEADAQV